MNDTTSRRRFLSRTAQAAVALPLLSAPAQALATSLNALETADIAGETLTILHTNDLHSRIDPFPMDGGRNQGQGGFARRATLVDQLRQSHANTLLLDAGDYFQGTPYFNLYKGELEIKLMSAMGYECVTLGNHDFDAGTDILAQRLSEASFPCVCANYTFANPKLKAQVKDYVILRKGNIKVGIYGLGINLDGLAPSSISNEVGYANPVETARRLEKTLHDQGCHLIICLSHLGIKARVDSALADPDLATKTRLTDLIIGGHTHTFLDEPREYRNELGRKTLVNQVGFAGIKLGQLDYRFVPTGKQVNSTNRSVK
jgi:5'-nucleotidase